MSSTPKYFDRVMNTSTTTGSGTYTLGTAVTGFQDWSVLGNGNSAYYCAFDVDSNGNPSGGWEVGLGTYTTSGTTLSRDTILASSNSGSAVSWAAGTRRIILTMPASDAPRKAVVDVFTTTGANTWTKRNGATAVFVQLIAGGGGGGSGYRGPTSSSCSGGGPGQAAATVEHLFQASILGSTETVTVGTGGAGGAGATVDGSGNIGSVGGNTTFGSWATAQGGQAGCAGVPSTFSSNWTGFNAGFPQAPGQSGSPSGTFVGTSNPASAAQASAGPGNGGPGGGISSSNVAATGGTGAGVIVSSSPAANSNWSALNTSTGATASAGNPGANGGSVTAGTFGFGGGGAGGSAVLAANGTAGGNGGLYGGGGGGGSASNNGFTSGAGGTGAQGIAVITTFF